MSNHWLIYIHNQSNGPNPIPVLNTWSFCTTHLILAWQLVTKCLYQARCLYWEQVIEVKNIDPATRARTSIRPNPIFRTSHWPDSRRGNAPIWVLEVLKSNWAVYFEHIGDRTSRSTISSSRLGPKTGQFVKTLCMQNRDPIRLLLTSFSPTCNLIIINRQPFLVSATDMNIYGIGTHKGDQIWTAGTP